MPEGAGGERPRVMVVDDHLSMAETLADALTEKGFDAVALASSPEDATRLVDGSPSMPRGRSRRRVLTAEKLAVDVKTLARLLKAELEQEGSGFVKLGFSIRNNTALSLTVLGCGPALEGGLANAPSAQKARSLAVSTRLHQQRAELMRRR